MTTLGPKLKSLIAILTGSIAWTLIMVKSGWLYSYGMGFWGPNGHDGVWHISLATSLARGSFGMPIFAGEKIKNYHIGFDLMLASLKWLTHIPVVNIYFQVLPPILALSVGFFVYKLVKEWQKSENSAFWAVVFTYFATSWGWIISVIRYRDIGGESMFWAQQSISSLINPPFALSLVILFAGLWCLIKKKYTLAILLFGTLGFIKIYAGILLLGSLFMAGCYEFVFKKNHKWLIVWVGAAILSVLFFVPLNKSSGKLIVWQPGWFLETMMAVSDRANWPKFYEAMINYRAAHNYLKGPIAYLVAFGIFVLGNLGLRVLGLRTLLSQKITSIEVLFGSLIIAGFAMPMFFLQKGTPWNTIQFSYYSLIFSGVLAGIYIAKLKAQVPIFIAFLVLTVPGVWGTLHQYLPNRPPAMIGTKELEALSYLSAQEPGTVLTPVYDQLAANAAQSKPPRPLYLYESTAYVSAFSAHAVFVEDQVNLNITDYAWQDRASKASNFFSSLDATTARQFLQDNHIKYVYLPQIYKVRPQVSQEAIGAKTIFDNHESAIWEIE